MKFNDLRTEEIKQKQSDGSTLDLIKELLIDSKVENPVEKLNFEFGVIRKKRKKPKISFQFVLAIVSALFVLLSISLNTVFLKKIDPSIGILTMTKNFLFSPVEFAKCIICKPYAITIGEYGNLLIAKEEAIKLLPLFKAVDLKQLKSGLYTIEISRFSSQKKANAEIEKIRRYNIENLKIRYLI